MAEVFHRTTVPLPILDTWRTRVKEDSEWRSHRQRFQISPRAFDDVLEGEMANHIRENFIFLGRDLCSSVLKQALVMLIHGFVAFGTLPAAALSFKCSTTYIRRFLKQSPLSLRRACAVRRPCLDEKECTNFTFSMHLALEIFGVTAVVNFDQSAWRSS
jgi:hypothetical protein